MKAVPDPLPPPESLEQSSSMWVDEAIWGHRLYDEQLPWFVFLEFLNVFTHEADKNRAFDEPNGFNTLTYRAAHRLYLRNILFNNPHLVEIRLRYPNDSNRWDEWLRRTKAAATGLNHPEFGYLKDHFHSFEDFCEIVSLVRSTGLEVNSKGRYQSLDLRNVRTLYPAYGQDRGSFVSTYKRENDISLVWPANLDKARQDGLVSEVTASKLLGLFQTFQQSYQAAVQGFADDGLACSVMVKQAEDYGVLLDTICREAKGDRNRESLLRPLLQIGSVIVDGGRVTAIVAPWHPLRLSAMANKALQVSSLLKHLLTAENIFFGDPPLFFKELEKELSHPYYPEIVLGWHDRKPEILSLTDHHLDYSLHESPVISNDGYDDTNESPAETSALIVDLTKRFLSLYPHERANLSVVLYNCDSARLPYSLVEKMNELHEDDDDMRCQIILRHRDGAKLRELYEKIIESSDADADSFGGYPESS
jgi:hypothetical protein